MRRFLLNVGWFYVMTATVFLFIAACQEQRLEDVTAQVSEFRP